MIMCFQSLENIISASVDEISLCPGFGPQKVKCCFMNLFRNQTPCQTEISDQSVVLVATQD